MPYSPCSIDATSAKNKWPSSRQRHFKDGFEENEPLLESMDRLKCKGCHQKHYKKRKGAKVQIFCVVGFLFQSLDWTYHSFPVVVKFNDFFSQAWKIFC